MTLNRNSNKPLYYQMMEELKSQINSGNYKVGQKIPTEPELAEIFKVSRITVRRTIEELCHQGYLVKKQGKGTFVETPTLYRKIEQQNNMSFTDTCLTNRRIPSSHVLKVERIHGEDWQRQFFDLSEAEALLYVERVLLADNHPVMKEMLYLSEKELPDFDASKLENGSFYQVLREEYRFVRSEGSRTTIEIGTAGQELSEQLDILSGEPVMIMKDYGKNQFGVPIYISMDLIVGSRYMISF